MTWLAYPLIIRWLMILLGVGIVLVFGMILGYSIRGNEG
jgi:hypothetical protein